MKIIFATNNAHKLEEARQILSDSLEIISLQDAGFYDDVEETGSTLKENAALKARVVFEATGLDCFADDTGLEIDALNGRPGVYSARYAGGEHDFEANIDKVLGELTGCSQRSARFRTVVCLIVARQEYFFDGAVEGQILSERHGQAGFGYDPVFQPEGCMESFAQMSAEAKNAMSHRGRALEKMRLFLEAGKY